MDVRIGVTYSPKEIDLDLADDTDPATLRAQVEAVLGKDDAVLWLQDRKGRTVGVPAAKVAYIEIGSTERERRYGFGS